MDVRARARARTHTHFAYTQFLSLRIPDRFVFGHVSLDLSKGICYAYAQMCAYELYVIVLTNERTHTHMCTHAFTLLFTYANVCVDLCLFLRVTCS